MCGIFFCLYKTGFFTESQLLDYFNKIKHRGPDFTSTVNLKTGFTFPDDSNESDCSIFIGFHRLAIVDTSTNANPMLHEDNVYLSCNGEIFNYKHLIEKYELKVNTKSDCEVILQYYRKYPESFAEFIKELDGDFAFILYDHANKLLFVSRDNIGVRPLFENYTNNFLMYASEAKALPQGVNLKPVEPGWITTHYFKIPHKLSDVKWANRNYNLHVESIVAQNVIRELLISAVKKRLPCDRPVGFLLSGGLDSSLIASIANELVNGKITTFSIGLQDSTDIVAARKVAKYLDSIHHEVIITTNDIISALPNVIHNNETYDVTTTRASIPMYLLSKYISEKTDIKVLFSGEGSDELFGGYLYFHNTPTLEAFKKETHRLINDLYLFDVLRADRSVSAWGLELRVPFLDFDFVTFVLNIDPMYKIPRKRIEKEILRKAFTNYLPKSILYRQKEAFSDGIGYNSVTTLKSFAEKSNTDINSIMPYHSCAIPLTFEEKLYYSIFHKDYGESVNLYTPYYWMPKWTENVTDPSATVLKMHNKNII